MNVIFSINKVQIEKTFHLVSEEKTEVYLTDLLSHGFDPPVLGLSGRRMRRSRHLHLTGVSREAV